MALRESYFDDDDQERGLRSMLEIESKAGPPVMRLLQQSRIALEAEYQRSIDLNYVRRLKDNWNPHAMGVIYVSERADGKVVVMDGQHRLHAFRLFIPTGTDPTVNCLVYRNLTPEQEAELFVVLNGNRLGPRPIQLYTASLKARRPEEVAIDAMVRAIGMRVADSNKDGQISCVLTLKHVVRLDGLDKLRLLLEILSGAYGKDKGGYTRAMIRGLNSFVDRFGGLYDKEHLIDALRRTDPDLIQRQARSFLGVSTSQDTAQVTGMVVHEVYNKGMRNKGRLPDWNDAEIINALRSRRAADVQARRRAAE